MNFFKIQCNENTMYKELYKNLEHSGNFILDKTVILLATKKSNKTISNILEPLNVEISTINPKKYTNMNRDLYEWVISEFRKDRIETKLKLAEKEKQDDLRNLYKVIRDAEIILEQGGDVIG